MTDFGSRSRRSGLRSTVYSAFCFAALMSAGAWAQEGTQIESVVVSGYRATLRNSVEVKRETTTISDAIVNDDIGALPDNSVGDALLRIAGVTTDRFKGNSNEISIRGLGPTLSFSTFNGREVSTAGPDRSVAFQQFPSELVKGVMVYKTQQASFLDGGVAADINLKSARPLDGEDFIQAEVRGVYLTKDASTVGRNGLFGRGNIVLNQQWRHTRIGDFGINIGLQHQAEAAPEDYYVTNSSFIPCDTSALAPTAISGTTAQQAAAGTSFNCAVRSTLNATNQAGTAQSPLYFATSSRTFQQKTTSETRDALMGALQWQPNERLNFVFDGQYSNRDSLEYRNQLGITEAARGIQPTVIGGQGNDFSKGALLSYTGNSNLEVQMERRDRQEEYIGGGFAAEWTGDKLTVTADLSSSRSHRTELQKATNMRSKSRVVYSLDGTQDVVPSVTFQNFDIDDPANFLTAVPASNTNYARYRLVTNRTDQILAARLDAKYDIGLGWLKALETGFRYSTHKRFFDNGNNTDQAIPLAHDVNGDGTIDTPAQVVAWANTTCRMPFQQSAFMSKSPTNLRHWAMFNNDCLFHAYTGADSLPLQADSRDPSDINVTENIAAAYFMADFAHDFGSITASGNVGVRYVHTTVDSSGYRSAVTVVPSVGGANATLTVVPGTITEISKSGGYDYWLPSLNLNFDLTEKTRLRFAASKSIARSGIETFGVGISPVLDPTGVTVGDVLKSSTTGNPALKPLQSWNADISFEYYLNSDTSVSVAPYYKWVKNAAFSAQQPLQTSLIANGTEVFFNAVAPTNDPKERHISGVEVSGSHVMSYLPAPLDTLGFSGAYNYAYANFNFPDPSTVGPYVSGANLIGLSNNTYNVVMFWNGWGLNLHAAYVFRSDYYKPNSNTNRSVKGSGIFNLSAQYDLTEHIQLKAQAQNLFNQRDIFYKPGADAITEVSETNPAYYFGIRVRY